MTAQRGPIALGRIHTHTGPLRTAHDRTARFIACLDIDQKQKPIYMGCYGIGMIWPLQIAPYAALIIQMKVGDGAQDTLCQKLHDDLTAANIDVLWDDRKKVRPGAKFKDADLIGIPLRLVVGRDAAEDKLEWSPRVGGDDAKEVITSAEAIEHVKAACTKAGR